MPPSKPTKNQESLSCKLSLSLHSAPRTLKLSRVQVSSLLSNQLLTVLLKCTDHNFCLGVMALLRPLLLDNVPSIQQSAALALGRLANYSDELAEAVVSNEILPQLVYSLSEQNVSPDPAFSNLPLHRH